MTIYCFSCSEKGSLLLLNHVCAHMATKLQTLTHYRVVDVTLRKSCSELCSSPCLKACKRIAYDRVLVLMVMVFLNGGAKMSKIDMTQEAAP